MPSEHYRFPRLKRGEGVGGDTRWQYHLSESIFLDHGDYRGTDFNARRPEELCCLIWGLQPPFMWMKWLPAGQSWELRWFTEYFWFAGRLIAWSPLATVPLPRWSTGL